MDIYDLKISSGEPSVSSNSGDDDNKMEEHNEEPGVSFIKMWPLLVGYADNLDKPIEEAEPDS